MGKTQYTLKVPSTEEELEKLESEKLSGEDLSKSATFWVNKYFETTGADHLKSLVNGVNLLKKIFRNIL